MTFDFLLKLLRREPRTKESHAFAPVQETEEESLDLAEPFPEPVTIEIRDIIDLHSIPPRQVRAVIEEYIEEAHKRGFRWVRIIHGKGVGVQREIVRQVLARASFVVDFQDAPPEAGGWGATIVTLRKQ